MGPSDSILKAPDSVSRLNTRFPGERSRFLNLDFGLAAEVGGRSLARGEQNPKAGKPLEHRFWAALPHPRTLRGDSSD
jgi:hypothetical protein